MASLVACAPFLQGCDLVVTYFLIQNQTKSKSSSASSASPAPDLSYNLYVANFASPGAAATEEANLDTNGGIPNPAVWTHVGSNTATFIWKGIPANMNAALIQGPLTLVYNIDNFERLDANQAVVEVPTSTNVYANSAISATTPKANASGPVDGVPVTTKITDPAHLPCVFALFTQNITTLRVRIWGASQASGDCVWSNQQALANTDTFTVGGASSSSTGIFFTTYVDATLGQSYLLPFGSDGSKGTLTTVSNAASTTGSLGTAVDSSGNLFVVATLSTGLIQLQKYSGATMPLLLWPASTTFSGTGNNFIGPRGVAVASNAPLSGGGTGTVIFFAGGQGTTGTHSIVRYDDLGTSGSYVWGPATVADPASKATSWSAIATSGTSSVLTTGDLSNTISGNVELLTQDTSLSTGSLLWPIPVATTGGGQATNNGNAIGIDGFGFAYVAGYFGSSGNGRDSVLLRYQISDGSGLTTLYKNTGFSGANEFLGIAVDTDGTTYLVGYVTLSGTTSMWIGRLSPGGILPLAWTATFNNGVGNDQALGVSLSGNFVYVVGQQTVTGPKNGLRVFKFVK
jgi:hypothetical protein